MEKQKEKKKISFLVVDDCKGMRQILSGCIEEYCKDRGITCNIDVAGNGKIGAETLNRTYVDVLFVDLKMPLMNGEELIRLLDIISPSTVPIIMTGSDGYQPPEDLPIEGFLEKPISEEALYEALDRIVDLFFQD